MAEAWDIAQEAPVGFGDFQAQGEAVRGLLHTLEEGTFVHAYLISGMEGVGKRTLARLITQYLLCHAGEEPDLLSGLGLPAQKPCGTCAACRQVLSGNHPDAVLLSPPEHHLSQRREDQGKSGIVVDDIREVVRIASTHTFEGGRRVIRIEHAEKMNPQAQNCLLKTLEEPPEGTVFLLLTDMPSLLLPTIVSRCRHVMLHAWPDQVVLSALEKHGVPAERRREALRVSGGSIGRALATAADEGYWQRRSDVMRDFFALPARSDIVRISGQWKDKKEQSDELLDDVEDMLHTLMLTRLGRLPQETLRDWPAPWQRMAREAKLDAFARLLDAVRDARKMRMNQVTWQAVLERLLLRLMEERTRWST